MKNDQYFQNLRGFIQYAKTLTIFRAKHLLFIYKFNYSLVLIILEATEELKAKQM